MDMNKSLATIRKEIKDAIMQKLADAQSTDLKDVKFINYGERTKPGELKIPAVWVVPEPHTPIPAGGVRMEHWFTFNFMALTTNNDPEVGAEAAEDLASRVYDVINEDKHLNDLVYDVIATVITPAYQVQGSKTNYWATVQFQFKVIRY